MGGKVNVEHASCMLFDIERLLCSFQIITKTGSITRRLHFFDSGLILPIVSCFVTLY